MVSTIDTIIDLQGILKIFESHEPSPFLGTDKDTNHSYGHIYNRLFTPYRKKWKTILEIGTCSGAFATVLYHFFEEADIHAIDLDLDTVKFGKDIPYIKFHSMDGTDENAPIKLGLKYDLIIEDASHIPADQIRSLDLFAPYLNDDGMYIIEDIADHSIQTKLSELADRHGLKMEWIDIRHIKHRYDDCLAVFTKNSHKQ